MAEEIAPGAPVRSDADLAAFIRERGVSNHHPVGTCRMGRESDAVVDQRLRVHGVGRLRVADASVMPSIIAELGYVIERHLQSIGLLRKPAVDEHQQKILDEKRAEFEARAKQADAFAKSHFPEGAQLCAKCSTAAVVMMDNCMTCLNCGDSKCG